MLCHCWLGSCKGIWPVNKPATYVAKDSFLVDLDQPGMTVAKNSSSLVKAMDCCPGNPVHFQLRQNELLVALYCRNHSSTAEQLHIWACLNLGMLYSFNSVLLLNKITELSVFAFTALTLLFG